MTLLPFTSIPPNKLYVVLPWQKFIYFDILIVLELKIQIAPKTLSTTPQKDTSNRFRIRNSCKYQKTLRVKKEKLSRSESFRPEPQFHV